MVPAKERMKKSRENKKRDAEQWEAHLQRERERDKLRRLKKKEELKTDLKAEGINREKIRARVKLYRERKKMLTPSSPIRQRSEKNSPIGTYKCVQSFGKAVNKVKRILPESPQKKAAVLKKIVSEIIGPEGKKLFDIPQKKPNKAVSDDEKKVVVDFYCRDDISRQAPGIKDFITVKSNDGGKTKFQKRHMILSVGEAYQEFKNSFPDIKIGKSKFYTLRPPYVLLQTDVPHNVCVCKYHFNVIELTESLRRAIQNFPQSHTEVLNQVSCDIGNESCMYSLCSICSKIDLKSVVSEDEKALLKKDISWKEWGEDENKRPLLKTVLGTCETALRKLELKLKHFKKHCFVKKTQSNYFNQVKSNLKHGEGVLQFDFAENYSVVTQDEIQSAHWSHSQITIFTCCLWLPKKEVQSFVVISDDRTHSKFSVWTFLKSVLSHIKSENFLNHVFIFSDNCAGQFKSRFILSNLCWFEHDFNVTAEWNFFSSSHGKGAMDGVGAVVKRTAWIAVKARKILISDAKDFYTFAKENVAGVTCLFISKEQIEENKPLLEKRWKTVKAIPGIQEGHHFRAYDEQDILIAKTSLSLMLRVNVFKPPDFEQPTHARKRLSYSQVYSDSESECEHMLNEENCQPLSSIHTSKVEVTDVKSGLFVLIEVESDRKKKKNSKDCNNYTYLGICQSNVDEEDEVKVLFLKSMSKDNTTFRPSDEAVSFIKFSQIICKLPEPELKPQGNRLYYQFPGPVTLHEKNV